MRYPETLTEGQTISEAFGYSVARFGDGELAIAKGGKSVSQCADPKLRMELIHILAGTNSYAMRLLPCVPRIGVGPRVKYWDKYAAPYYAALMRAPRFGSSFISRPDVAPWIDTAAYWDTVRSLWRGKQIVYVGGATTLADVMHKDAAGIQIVAAPKRDAYSVIDKLETECTASNRGRTVVIALGAAGTALAARLAKRGIHALDLGHIGQFMTPENQGAFAFKPEELATPEYRALLQHAHATTNWGRGGASWATPIAEFAKKMEVADVLDYGAGGRTLAPALAALGVKCYEYDPGVEAISTPPKIADLVVSTDVFEHIEPANVDNVLRHAYLLARKAGYFVVATKPAKKILADGRNAHLVCEEWSWWEPRFRAAGWHDIKLVSNEYKKFVIKCRK